MKGIPITITREQVFALQRVLKVANQCECTLGKIANIDVAAVLRVIKDAQMSFAEQRARSQIRSAASLA